MTEISREAEVHASQKCAKFVVNPKRTPPFKDLWASDALDLPPFADHEDAQFVHSAIESMQNLPTEWRPVFHNLVTVQDPDTAQPFLVLVELVRDSTKIASHEPLWATQILVKNCAALTNAAIDETVRVGGAKDGTSDAASTAIRQAFRVTVTDYEGEEPQQGRTRECYSISVCLSRLYVKMHAYSLAEGIMNAINGYSSNIPPLSHSDPKIQIQFLFYRGMLSFYQQKYTSTCKDSCTASAVPTKDGGTQRITNAQLEHIMVYLIPTMYLTHNRTPSAETWALLPRLKYLYKPSLDASRQGNYNAFLNQSRLHAHTLREYRLYLAFDLMIPRSRLNLSRRCWEASDRPKRIPIKAYAEALKESGFSSPQLSSAEAAEFYISQFILKGEVKGYIHHNLQSSMLSKTQPFPTLVKPMK